MNSLTYGQLPTWEAFDAAFDAECSDGYRITLSRSDSEACERFRLGDGEWNGGDLWRAIGEIHTAWVESPIADSGIDGAIDLVASILQTLGFEWI